MESDRVVAKFIRVIAEFLIVESQESDLEAGSCSSANND